MTMKNTDAVARTAERALTDTRFDWARPIPRRRIVVGVWVMSVAWVIASTWNDAPVWTLAGLIAFGAAIWTLRGVVRKMADLPEQFIDERMKAVRDRAYRLAYTALSSLTAASLVMLAIADDASRIAFDVEGRHLEAVLWLVIGLGLGLPSAIVALTEPEV